MLYLTKSKIHPMVFHRRICTNGSHWRLEGSPNIFTSIQGLIQYYGSKFKSPLCHLKSLQDLCVINISIFDVNTTDLPIGLKKYYSYIE